MSEAPLTVTPAAAAVAPSAVAIPGPAGRWLAAALVLLLLASAAAVFVAWKAQVRVHEIEQELVRRQQDSAGEAGEARLVAKQAAEVARESAAKTALLEARVAEVALQRGQLEDLLQSLSRSRDENVLVDIEAAIRVAQQQSAITGSAEPLVAALKQADERLARYSQPRLEGVRRAINRDLDRVKAVGIVDLSSLGIRLDEAVRLVDELPLLAVAEPRREGAASAPGRGTAGSRPAAPGEAVAAGKAAVPGAAASASGGSSDPATWWPALRERAAGWSQAVWGEVRSLVRLTRIEQPEAMLLAPEQMYFVRENLKLRLLNARLAVLSRQFDTAQADLQSARTTLERYFDRNSRKVGIELDLVRQVAAQARNVSLPRPDETLAALAAANAGR